MLPWKPFQFIQINFVYSIWRTASILNNFSCVTLFKIFHFCHIINYFRFHFSIQQLGMVPILMNYCHRYFMFSFQISLMGVFNVWSYVFEKTVLVILAFIGVTRKYMFSHVFNLFLICVIYSYSYCNWKFSRFFSN